MVPELCEAAKNPEIKYALISKISRERIGIEFEKMITGPYPLLSLSLIRQLDLYPVIMAPVNIKSGTIADASLAVNAVGVVQWLCCNNTVYPYLNATSDEEKRNLVLIASVLPYLDVISETKKKDVPAVQLVLRESIKVKYNYTSLTSQTKQGEFFFFQ
jgi:tRNA nucleotidyltransferase (CCA-adding enzyme)